MSVKIARGDIVGIGKIKVLPSNRFPYEMPMLSFIVIGEPDDTFSSVCIHLHVEGSGRTADEAREKMKDHILDFLRAVFTEERVESVAWEYLEELFQIDDCTKELWDAYRTVQVRLSQEGVKTDVTSELIDRIAYLEAQISKLRAVKEKIDRKLADESEVTWEYQKAA